MLRLTVTAASRLRHPALRSTSLRTTPHTTAKHIQPSTLWAARHSSTSASRTCPSCSAQLPTMLPACPNCAYISRPPPKTTYFDILGVPYDSNPFDVNPAELKNRFRELQRIIHPDKWSVKGPEAHELAVELSGIVNKAYGTLLNPYTRAEYIMQLQGIEIGEADSLDDPELIMEVMEARESLESAESREEVDEIQRENQEKIEEILPELSTAIAQKDWDTARSTTIKLKYLQGISAAADAWPNSLHDH